jgi:hypothetical protein
MLQFEARPPNVASNHECPAGLYTFGGTSATIGSLPLGRSGINNARRTVREGKLRVI